MKRILFMALIAACSDTTNQINITKTVGSEGGTVSVSTGSSVVVPMGALSNSTNITISKLDVTAPAGTVLVGPAYDFGPNGTTFAQPVTITLPFDASLLPAGRTASDIVIYTAAAGSTQYTPLTTTLSGSNVTTTTSHFTVYLPAAPAAGVVSDMSMPVNNSPDFSFAPCTPQCTTSSGNSCSCTETCSTSTITMVCTSNGTSGFNCVCKVNGQSISPMPLVLDCTSSSDLNSAFSQCAG